MTPAFLGRGIPGLVRGGPNGRDGVPRVAALAGPRRLGPRGSWGTCWPDRTHHARSVGPLHHEHAVWVSMVEPFFAIVAAESSNLPSFTSRADPVSKLRRLVATYNETAEPFIWTYSAWPLEAAPELSRDQHPPAPSDEVPRGRPPSACFVIRPFTSRSDNLPASRPVHPSREEAHPGTKITSPRPNRPLGRAPAGLAAGRGQRPRPPRPVPPPARACPLSSVDLPRE